MYQYNVEEFLFESKTQSEEAKKEAKKVAYIKAHTDFQNLEVVLELYHQLISKEIFRTPIGINFLCELRLILLAADEKREDLPLIPVSRNRTHRKIEPQQPRKNYKKLFHITTALAVIFGISVVGMFAIMKLSKNNVTILNYRNAIIDEYQDWEKELQEKEQFLNEWEAELNNQEDTSQQQP